MGQQCSNTVGEVEEVILHHTFQPSSEDLKIQIELMRNKNQDLLNVAQKVVIQNSEEQFLGYTQNGLKQGYGQLKTSDQKRYYGYFKDNLPHIKGVLIFSHDHYYIGQFHLGKMHGKGKEISSFFTFQGDFHLDHKKYGKLVTEDFKYEGSFEEQDNLFGGYGELTLKNGQKYIGNFLKGEFHGEGMYYDENNSLVYEGGWMNGLYHGIGKYYWEDGSYFEGEYVNGSKHGEGKYFGAGDDLVHGVWEEGSITSRYIDRSINSEQKQRINRSAHSTKVEEIY